MMDKCPMTNEAVYIIGWVLDAWSGVHITRAMTPPILDGDDVISASAD
jgi:hypothetical protein